MSDYLWIKNHQELLNRFGSWPSFHDAEIVSVLLDRHKGTGDRGPTVTIKIHAFTMTSEIDERGYYKTINHAVVTFCFTDVVDFELKYGFGNQNPISNLSITDIRADQLENINFDVEVGSHINAEMAFKCAGIEVIAIEPGIPDDSVYV